MGRAGKVVVGKWRQLYSNINKKWEKIKKNEKKTHLAGNSR